MKKMFNFISHKKLFLIVILLSSIFLVACTGARNRPQEFFTYQGREGVKINFLDNNPPREVYENTDVFVLAEIWNKGAFDLTDNLPVWVGVNYDPLYFSEPSTSFSEYFLDTRNRERPLFLHGKSLAYPEGEKLYVPLIALRANRIPGTLESPNTVLEAFACYPYTTFFSQQVCIDTDVFKVDSNPICVNRKVYTHSNQGAPVAVSRVEVDMIPISFQESGAAGFQPVVDEYGQLIGLEESRDSLTSVIIMPSLRIHVRNVDSGTVFTPKQDVLNVRDICSTSSSAFSYRDLNTVKVYAYLGNSSMDCGDGLARITNNDGFVRCTLSPDNLGFVNTNYELPLRVELEYYYRVTTSRPIKIIRTMT